MFDNYRHMTFTGLPLSRSQASRYQNYSKALLASKGLALTPRGQYLYFLKTLASSSGYVHMKVVTSCRTIAHDIGVPPTEYLSDEELEDQRVSLYVYESAIPSYFSQMTSYMSDLFKIGQTDDTHECQSGIFEHSCRYCNFS
jgi:hypothetical protein